MKVKVYKCIGIIWRIFCEQILFQIGKFPCHEVRPYQCGRPCGRDLACGNHSCSLICHPVEGTDDPRKVLFDKKNR